ncbi:Hypothetical protein FKW44_007171 [Caligus rogercresseyi]|uniref:Uncharacterized protein n=1 Tax=Caligus rogercresseyi TaxID=217165 RepID=A0A7T8KEB5_CALRO|nr:Hypothetical protein FKW44_007171 [Caligus rogercresseyi]
MSRLTKGDSRSIKNSDILNTEHNEDDDKDERGRNTRDPRGERGGKERNLRETATTKIKR